MDFCECSPSPRPHQPNPLEQFLKSWRTHVGGQIKAIIISWIIMNIFLLSKGRLGSQPRSRYGSCARETLHTYTHTHEGQAGMARHETDSPEIILHDHE